MGLISLTDMHFYAYHGWYEEEQIIGNDYWIDIMIESRVEEAGLTDELGDTINYETVYFICKNEMKKPRKLLEAVGSSIFERLKFQFPKIREMKIVIKKQNPPLGGKVGFATVEMTDSFSSKCGKCGRGMVCYGDDSCWCQDLNISPHTLQTLEQQYDGCLCRNCLNLYTDKVNLRG